MIYTLWCDTEECEYILHTKFHAKTLCIPTPSEQFSFKKYMNSINVCGICGKFAVTYVLIGKSF